MDGLLFDTENLFLSQSEATEKEIGYDIPRELHYEAIGRTFEDIERIFTAHFGEDFPYEEFITRSKERVYERIQRYGIPMKEGVHELTAALSNRGAALVLASSSPFWIVETNLEAAKMQDVFSLLVSGDEVERGKPAPDIFLLAAEKAGFDPGECVVFEDSNNGVRAAHEAGMRPVMIPDIKPPEEDVREMTFRIYRSLGEAAADLDVLLG
jgi:HAD superfamily hydrolase (TIGR01509 family)